MRAWVRVAVPLLLLALAGACIPRVPPQRLAAATPVSLAVVVDPDRRGEPSPAAPAVLKTLADELRAHNLEAQPQEFGPWAAKRLTELRFAAVREASAAPWVALVELRPRFFSQMDGAYRWEVAARITLSRRDGTPASDAVVFPVVLQHEHERETEAIQAAAADLATRVGALVDGMLQGATSRAPARPTALYFAMVDRFANGDPSNDGVIDPASPQAFHGGDLEGVRAHLDWLTELGVDALWLSPIARMRTEPWHGYGAYHGYWTWDLANPEPRFGDAAAVRRLSDELHARGIGLYLDLVLNHVGPDAPLLQAHPDWFHHHGGISDWHDPVQITDYDVHGLTDFAQEVPAAEAYLLDASRRWLRVRAA